MQLSRHHNPAAESSAMTAQTLLVHHTGDQTLYCQHIGRHRQAQQAQNNPSKYCCLITLSGSVTPASQHIRNTGDALENPAASLLQVVQNP
jgi:hypothetical protein